VLNHTGVLSNGKMVFKNISEAIATILHQKDDKNLPLGGINLKF